MAVEHLVDIDRETGEYIQGWPRIRQSIITIATTRLRTRLMRLWFGCEFLDMQDKPANEQTFVEGIGALIEAINEYEPEFRVTRVQIEGLGPLGSCTITVEGVDLVEQAARRVTTTL